MKPRHEIIVELNNTARGNGFNLCFRTEGRLWSAIDRRGRVIWCGTLKEMRRIAAGKDIV